MTGFFVKPRKKSLTKWFKKNRLVGFGCEFGFFGWTDEEKFCRNLIFEN
jgi:hypothetical protein